MDNLELKNIQTFDTNVTFKTALFVIAVDQIPPHIGLIVDNMYFSYSARGTIVELPLTRQVTKINRLKLSSVIIDLDVQLNLKEVKSRFETLTSTCINQSCFIPILDALSERLLIPEGCKFLFEFIPYINSVNRINCTYQLNAEHLISKNETIPLRTYGQHEINLAIDKSRKYAKV